MDDFERRRELRRQKREEMRLEAERLSYERNDDDEEEAARERRRRARQERLRLQRDEDGEAPGTEKTEVNAQNSVTEELSQKTSTATIEATNDEEAALLDRLAKREERRQRRLQEALERQRELDPTITDDNLSQPRRSQNNEVEENETAAKDEKPATRRGQYEYEEIETVTKSSQKNDWRQEEKEEICDAKEEEKADQDVSEENQVDVTLEINNLNLQQDIIIDIKKEQNDDSEDSRLTEEREQERIETEERRAAEERERERIETEERRAAEERERERIEAEERRAAEERERERNEAEERRAAEERERERIEAEERRAAEDRERERIETEERRAAEQRERERLEAEERRAAEQRERERLEAEKKAAEEKERKKAEEKRVTEERERERIKAEERKVAEVKERKRAEEKAKLEAKKKEEKSKTEEKKVEDRQVKEKKVQEEKAQPAFLRKQEKGEDKDARATFKKGTTQEEKSLSSLKKEEIREERGSKEKITKDGLKPSWDRKKTVPDTKVQNGESVHGLATHKLKHVEKTVSTSSVKAHPEVEEVDAVPKVEAGKRLDELRRRRGETENEEFDKMKQKQQQAAVELEELKKKREDRRKILEGEEQRRKEEQAQQKAKEEEEKRRLKEEIEKRRAEAAEKRQKMPEESLADEKKPFKCFTPKGSSLKIEERAEFLNKSAQKSGVKTSHLTPMVSKIDSRLEQYTSAIEGTKSNRPAKAGASDLPLPAEGVRNIKNMWEKGNVFSSPGGTGTPNKETAGLKVGVSSRINEWLTKTPESNKSPAAKPSDLKPGDVSGKRNLWEKQTAEKPGSPIKVTAGGKSKANTNGLRQYEKDS
uniref:Caldesmon isoform X2 n=1 Tax=Geotrypetes seraphini TaxID=260995 RepID=A0A6P8RPS5_GEOSA|nr:caldesmon isoform X2 [Geotrypetes seraphini]XP_033807279.1 caldesmon isoform X2 [Geotrypetes seraphini]XP_033807280.1 caldesmon isoform X2 [Geotrypetes seraphini]